jgi:hypothetical protein
VKAAGKSFYSDTSATPGDIIGIDADHGVRNKGPRAHPTANIKPRRVRSADHGTDAHTANCAPQIERMHGGFPRLSTPAQKRQRF